MNNPGFQGEFNRELERLINRYNKEAGSDTPDFLLAQYLLDCLNAYDSAVKAREKWYGRVFERGPIPVEPLGFKQTEETAE